MKLTKEDCDNLLDALEEWNDVVGCKDCDPIDDEEGMSVGLNYDRYVSITDKLKYISKENSNELPNM